MAKSVNTNTAAAGSTVNSDGTFLATPRPATPEFIQQMARQAAGLPPVDAEKATSFPRLPRARGQQPETPAPDGPVLPFVSVARQAIAHEIGRLRGRAEGIERDISRGVFGANGSPNPHLIEQQAKNREALAEIRAEIERLNGLSDHECRVWAFEHGVR